MNRLALGSLVLGIAAATPAAFAQTGNCPPGSWICADVSINGGINGNVQVGPVGPPNVVVQPPSRVYVTPQPPVVVMPPPPRMYIQPAPRVYLQPPPVVYYQPQPTTVYYQQQQPQYQQYQLYYQGYQPGQAPQRNTMFGLMAGGGAAFAGNGNSMGIGSLGFRVRGRGHWGMEGLVGGAWGHDYNGDRRFEVPVALSGIVYFNPQHAFQVYGLFGLDYSWANVTYDPLNVAAHGGLAHAEYQYLGGHVGLGAEWHLGRYFALWADVRGFVRGRVDGGAASNPEFARTLSDGTTQTSNTSVGVLTQGGISVFF